MVILIFANPVRKKNNMQTNAVQTEPMELDLDILNKAIEYLKVKPSTIVAHVSKIPQKKIEGIDFVVNSFLTDNMMLFIQDNKLIGQTRKNDKGFWEAQIYKVPLELYYDFSNTTMDLKYEQED